MTVGSPPWDQGDVSGIPAEFQSAEGEGGVATARILRLWLVRLAAFQSPEGEGGVATFSPLIIWLAARWLFQPPKGRVGLPHRASPVHPTQDSNALVRLPQFCPMP